MVRHALVVLLAIPSLTGCGLLLGLDSFEDEAPAGGGNPAGGAGGEAGAGGSGGPVNTIYVDAVLEDSPVGYWRLGETAGPAVNLVDPTTNAAVGKDVKTGVEGVVGGDGAFSFTNSAYANVSVVDLLAFDFADTTPFSLELWFRVHYETMGDALLTRFDHGVGYSLRLDLESSLQFARYPAVDADLADVPDVVSFRLPDGFASSYHHVVAVYAAETLQLFYDGEAAEPTTGVTRGMTTISSVPLVFGAEPEGGGFYFDGDLDEVAVYDHPLTIDRVLAHYCGAIPGASVCSQ